MQTVSREELDDRKIPQSHGLTELTLKTGNTDKSYLHTQWNPGQNSSDIGHRARKKKKLIWEHRRPQTTQFIQKE